MQEMDLFAVEDVGEYEIVAFARGEEPIYYDETIGACPAERGGWWMATKRDSSFAIYRGEVGCSRGFKRWRVVGTVPRSWAGNFAINWVHNDR